MNYYFFNNNILELDFILDNNYTLGGTYEDILNNKFVKLSEQQVNFYLQNPNSSIEEIWNMKKEDEYIPTIEDYKNYKIYELDNYDKSGDVNTFYINNMPAWLDRETRNTLRDSLLIQKEKGNNISTLWYGLIPLQVPTEEAIELLKQVEAYAFECFNVTAKHKLKINSLDNIEEINSYNFKEGYPEKLMFTLTQDEQPVLNRIHTNETIA